MSARDRMNRAIHAILLAGVLVSMSLIAIGLVLAALDPDAGQAWIGLGDLGKALRGKQPVALVELGLLVLIATPLLRILTALVLFTSERDYKFVLISLVVLGMVCLAVLIDV